VSTHRIYRYTAIARPVEPHFPTNKAVLLIVPIVALVAALLTMSGFGSGGSPGSAALGAALAAFGAWAVTRELAPDDNPAAFVAMALAVAAVLWLGPHSVLPLFVALFLTRIVNRTTGTDVRWTDSVLVTVFVMWASVTLEDPLLGLAACIAFFLDASLVRPARFQLAFGMICLFGSMLLVVRDGVAMPALAQLEGPLLWLGLLVLAAYLVVLFTTSKLASVGDVSGQPLNTPRVRGGMFVAGLLAAQAPVLSGEAGINPLLWACLASVALTRPFMPR